jgi:hypothetical protein
MSLNEVKTEPPPFSALRLEQPATAAANMTAVRRREKPRLSASTAIHYSSLKTNLFLPDSFSFAINSKPDISAITGLRFNL